MRVVLIDLSGIVHKIWHVSGSDPDPDHTSTASVARVRSLAATWRDSRVIVCCDSRRNWRKELAPTYKANRDTKPEALFYQLDRTKQILRSDGLQVIEVDGFEADDVIAACVAKLSVVPDVELIVVASADKDLIQLVQEEDTDGRHCAVDYYSLSANETRGSCDVIAKFGVRPELVGDWLALVGDTADNVKGAPGIGDKKATALLRRLGSLSAVFSAVEAAAEVGNKWSTDEDPDGLNRAESIKRAWSDNFDTPADKKLVGGEAVWTSLKNSGSTVALAKRLVTLRDDVPLPPVTELLSVPVQKEPEPEESFAPDEFLSAPMGGPQSDEPTEQVDVEPPPQSQTMTMNEPKHETEQTMTMSTVIEQQVDQQTGEVTETQVLVQEQTSQPAKPGNAQPAAVAANGKNELNALLEKPMTANYTQALEPQTPAAAVVIAGKLFKSNMFSGYGNSDAVLSTILYGRELGFGAIGSLRAIHNIKGKHSISADALVAMCLKSSLCEYFEPVEQTDVSATWECKRKGRQPKRYTFKIDQAKRAKLAKTDSGWDNWPDRMCSARAKAFLARDIFGDICFGLYTPEELASGDFDSEAA